MSLFTTWQVALPGHLSKSYQTALNYHKLAHWRHYLWKVEWLENSDLKKLFFSQTEGGLELVCGVWTSQHSSAHTACVSLLRYIWYQKISKSNQSSYDGSTGSLFIQLIIFRLLWSSHSCWSAFERTRLSIQTLLERTQNVYFLWGAAPFFNTRLWNS